MSKDEKHLLRNKILGVMIRDARLRSGKTVAACAAHLGVGADHYADMESGRQPISLPEVEVLALHLGVSPHHLLGDELLAEPKGLNSEELLTLRNRVIGVMLSRARLEAGKSLQECAQAIGAPEDELVAYEQGQSSVPLAELEELAGFLQVPLDSFLDDTSSPIGQQSKIDQDSEQLGHLPPDLQAFVQEPLNEDYLRTAVRLSVMPVGQLRSIAETLLEITY